MLLPVLQDLLGGIPAGRSHDTAARVGRRTANIKVADWRSILCPAEDRAHQVQLLKRQFALEDVALGQRERTFDIERSQDLTMQNDIPEIGSILGQSIDNRVSEFLAL